mmetsp:Transcript_30575/g.67564  ORF Transcript_30575/g.67564 Transcript_30575/m.67564 type:complete len:209 (-) Transcript_30575:415-1041(-)
MHLPHEGEACAVRQERAGCIQNSVRRVRCDRELAAAHHAHTGAPHDLRRGVEQRGIGPRHGPCEPRAQTHAVDAEGLQLGGQPQREVLLEGLGGGVHSQHRHSHARGEGGHGHYQGAPLLVGSHEYVLPELWNHQGGELRLEGTVGGHNVTHFPSIHVFHIRGDDVLNAHVVEQQRHSEALDCGSDGVQVCHLASIEGYCASVNIRIF